jgi:hypothetical protein
MNLGTCILVGVVAGIGASLGYITWSLGDQMKLEPKDLLPMLPPYPPLPQFVYTKPEVLTELRRR